MKAVYNFLYDRPPFPTHIYSCSFVLHPVVNGPPNVGHVNILKKFVATFIYEMCFQQLKIWKEKIGISPTNMFCSIFYVMQSCTLYENSIS